MDRTACTEPQCLTRVHFLLVFRLTDGRLELLIISVYLFWVLVSVTHISVSVTHILISVTHILVSVTHISVSVTQILISVTHTFLHHRWKVGVTMNETQIVFMLKQKQRKMPSIILDDICLKFLDQ